MLSYFACIALFKAGEWKIPAHLIKTSTARKYAVGKGNADKQFVYDYFRGKINLSPFSSGGNDQSDAIAVGVAADILYG